MKSVKSNNMIIIWLGASAFMVFAMAVIGAITRLTESGLSMVEWRPLIGFLPPLSDAEWQRVFDLYRETPEYIHKNAGMDIGQFKTIFFWEWFHRLWGRLIGLVYALPFFWFLCTRQIPNGYTWKLTGLLCLGGLQGIIGWWMVKSGLIDRPDVSHYRLATHLSLALIIFSLLWWLILDLWPHKQESATYSRGVKNHAALSLIILAITIVWGAFVAGLDAGKIYNTYPLMNGSFTPPEAFYLTALWDSHAWVQFSHRWIAIIAALLLIGLTIITRSALLGGMVIIQVILGITTLLTGLNIVLATLHQAGAIILIALTLTSVYHIFQEKRFKLKA